MPFSDQLIVYQAEDEVTGGFHSSEDCFCSNMIFTNGLILCVDVPDRQTDRIKLEGKITIYVVLYLPETHYGNSFDERILVHVCIIRCIH